MAMFFVALAIIAFVQYMISIVDAQGYTPRESRSNLTSQYEALRQLYLSTNMYSESSVLLHNWKFDNNTSSGEYCNFTGIACDRAFMVTTIELNNTKLTGRLPDTFGGLSNLRRLRLFNNSIHGAIPVSLLQLPTLQVLNLGQNLLSGTLPEFAPSAVFTRLSLRRNAISGTIPHSICNLTNLVVLEMSQLTKMRGSIPKCLGSLTALTALRVSDIGLTGTVPTDLCNEREMNGLVPNTFGCDAIACPVGTFQRSVGRQSNEDTPCVQCSVPSNVIGTTTCQWHEVNEPSLSPSTKPSAATQPPTGIPGNSVHPTASGSPSIEATLLPFTSYYPVARTPIPSLSPTLYPVVAVNQSSPSRDGLFGHPGYVTGIVLLCVVVLAFIVFAFAWQHRPLLPNHKRLTNETSSHPGSSVQESSAEADLLFKYPPVINVEVKKPESNEFNVDDDISLNFNDIYFAPFNSARGVELHSLALEKAANSKEIQHTDATMKDKILTASNEKVLGAVRRVRFNVPDPIHTTNGNDPALTGREGWLSWIMNPLFDPIATCGTPCQDISNSDVDIASAISLDSGYSNLSSLFVAHGVVTAVHPLPRPEVSSVLGIRDLHSMNDDGSIDSKDGSVTGNIGAIFRQNLESRLRARATWNSIHHDFGKQGIKSSGEGTGEV